MTDRQKSFALVGSVSAIFIAASIASIWMWQRPTLGPDVPLGAADNFIVMKVIGEDDTVLARVHRLGNGKASYEYHAKPEEVIAELVKDMKLEEIQRRQNGAEIAGDCILWHGSKYCTGSACRANGTKTKWNRRTP